MGVGELDWLEGLFPFLAPVSWGSFATSSKPAGAPIIFPPSLEGRLEGWLPANMMHLLSRLKVIVIHLACSNKLVQPLK